jgi:hypothetical protein
VRPGTTLPSPKTQSGSVGRNLGSEGDRLVTSGHTEIQIYRLNKASIKSSRSGPTRNRG